MSLFIAAAALVDWRLLLGELSQAQLRWVAAALALVPAYIYVKALRWRVLIEPIAATSTGQLLPAVWAGNAGNYIVPHFGELVRVVLAGQQINANRSALLASIALERFFDFAALGILVLLALLPGGVPSAALSAALAMVATLAVALLAAATVFLLWPGTMLQLAERAMRPFAPSARAFVENALRQGMTGLWMMRTPRLIVHASLLSLVQWILIGGCTAMSMAAVGLPVSIESVGSVVLLNVVGLVLPAAPGHVGTIQVAFIVALQGFGIAREPAFAASLVFNAVMVLPVMLVGLPILSRAGIRLGAYFAGGKRGDSV